MPSELRASAFHDVVGHAQAVATLEAMHREGRAPQALLISGPRGSGRRTIAQRFALMLLLGDSAGTVARNNPTRERILHGIHPDVLLVEREEGRRQLSMDAVRSLRDEFALKPQEAARRVAILPDADRLSSETGNALLKLLEEPPRTSHLVLTAGSETTLMPTLLSRCVRLRLDPLPQAELMHFLQQRGFAGSEAALAAAAANGAPGKALALASSGFATLLVPAAATVLSTPTEPFGLAARLFEVLDQDREKKNLEATRERVRGLLEALLFLSSLAERKSSGSSVPQLAAEVEAALPCDGLNGLRLERMLAAHARIDANVAPQLVLEELILDLQALLGPVGRA